MADSYSDKPCYGNLRTNGMAVMGISDKSWSKVYNRDAFKGRVFSFMVRIYACNIWVSHIFQLQIFYILYIYYRNMSCLIYRCSACYQFCFIGRYHYLFCGTVPQKLIYSNKQYRQIVIATEAVPWERVSRYGIIGF